MQNPVLTTIAITGFGIAFFHAAIPTHWLPFVLTARAQKWPKTKALAITAVAGTGHVLVTAALGFLIAWLGIALSDRIGQWFPRLAGMALIAFGVFYLYRQLSGREHTHLHLAPGHRHAHKHPHEQEQGDEHTHEGTVEPTTRTRSDGAAILSLLTLLTFSPCEAFIPIYVGGVRYGWSGFALLTAILSGATVAGMIVFTWLALTGIEQIKLRAFEKYESVVIGGLLCLVGLLIILYER